ncbi:hypothetical protein SARI_01164 [Salmonella enterica subsp. arizonae serovar 62:z4,z23:-]|uniref:Uncharacterized protein n=1 Tax=Salmonella arizonae (strain ATCC BAA-731 / CDC346-86 / RSK2980) TaxID=41514 RepID=A9MP88_SALAR|nr:hypothetical protein SARI_01164 [Salmonella enterica subsp. arizonae serovar 62:z4,z23:-]
MKRYWLIYLNKTTTVTRKITKMKLNEGKIKANERKNQKHASPKNDKLTKRNRTQVNGPI